MDPVATPPPAAPPVARLTYTTEEACAALGISHVTLWRLEKRGLIHAVPGIRHKLWPIRELERFVASGGPKK